MLVSNQGVIALRSLRLELQEDAGKDFPHSVVTELLVLRDVCKKLELNIFQCQEILSDSGWSYVTAYINTPVGIKIQDTNLIHNGSDSSITP